MNDKALNLTNKEHYGIDDLLEIMTMLRSEGGCPWDREQTHKSIRKNFIEEVYEVCEAIDTNNMNLMREELGDVLLQVVFHSRMCEEDGEFNFDDVCNDICAKLILRHPHIFGDVKADDSTQVLVNWEKIKQESKHRENVSEVLDGVSKALPSLMRAGKLAKKAAKAGVYTLPSEKLSEQEIARKLFELSALAEAEGIDAEQALYGECERFIEKQIEAEKLEGIK